MPTIATMVPRAAFAWVTRRLKGEVGFRWSRPTGSTTPAVAEEVLAARRRRHGLDGAAVPRRCGVRQQGGGGPGRRDQHLHRLQPGLPRPDLLAQDRVVPGQSARLPRDRDRPSKPRRRAKKRSRSSAPARPGWPARPRPPSRPRGHAVRRRRPRSAASSTSRGGFRARRSSPRRCAISAAASSGRASTCGLNHRVDAAAISRRFDHVVLATGIVPRMPAIPGIDHPKVASYLDIVLGRRAAGKRVAIIGAGGIGFDVGEFLTHARRPRRGRAFRAEWGIDPAYRSRGGLKAPGDEAAPRARCGCCSARRARSAKAWRRPPAGSAARCSRSAA